MAFAEGSRKKMQRAEGEKQVRNKKSLTFNLSISSELRKYVNGDIFQAANEAKAHSKSDRLISVETA